jgi:DNA repair exonuclease SbcCD ATPase subunit
MKEKQQENDRSFSSVNINGKDVSGAAPNRNAEASNDGQESSASENASNVTNENTSLTPKTREKEAFPVFSAFFASPETRSAVKSSSFTSLGASPSGAMMEERTDTTEGLSSPDNKEASFDFIVDKDEANDAVDEPLPEGAAAKFVNGDDPSLHRANRAEASSNTSQTTEKEVSKPDKFDVTLKSPFDEKVEIVATISSDTNGQRSSSIPGDANGANGYNENCTDLFKKYKTTSMEELLLEVQEARQNATESKDRVAALQLQLDQLQKELDFAENEYQQYLDIKKQESANVNARLNEVEALLQKKQDLKKKAEEEFQASAKQRQRRLLKEIEEVKFALREAKADLDDEIETSNQIQARLAQAEAQTSSEKAAFDNEQAELLAEIQARTEKVADTEIRIQRESEKFEEERVSLGKMLQEQITRLAETNARVQLEQSLFSMNQAETKRNIDEITLKLKETENKLLFEKNQSIEEINKLKGQATELREKLKSAEERLESEQRVSRQTQEDLEMRGVFERVKAKNLAAELEDQRKLYQREINGLEETSAQSRAELAKAQYLLETTLARFAKEKNELSDEIANSKRIRKLKAKQMSQRYREIREELTEMWQGERRKARDEQKALLNMYTSKLSDLEEAQPRLERKVIEAQELTEDLRSRAAAVMKDRMELLEEARLSELRFMQTVQDRNTAISALEYERDDLQEDLAAREEKLKTYQSSMRVLFGLSMKLIRKRLGATRKRLLSPFRGRRKAKELVDRSTMNADLANWGRMSIELDSGDVKKD